MPQNIMRSLCAVIRPDHSKFASYGPGYPIQIWSYMAWKSTVVFGAGKAEWIGEPVKWPRGHLDSSPLVKQFSCDNHSDPTEFNFNSAVLCEGKSSWSVQ